MVVQRSRVRQSAAYGAAYAAKRNRRLAGSSVGGGEVWREVTFNMREWRGEGGGRVCLRESDARHTR